MICKVCGAPAEIILENRWLNGVDSDGDFLTELIRVQCVVGHWYDEERRLIK